jgi:hypothetical protein
MNTTTHKEPRRTKKQRRDDRVHTAVMSLPYDMVYAHGGDRRVVVDASILEKAILAALED